MSIINNEYIYTIVCPNIIMLFLHFIFDIKLIFSQFDAFKEK